MTSVGHLGKSTGVERHGQTLEGKCSEIEDGASQKVVAQFRIFLLECGC